MQAVVKGGRVQIQMEESSTRSGPSHAEAAAGPSAASFETGDSVVGDSSVGFYEGIPPPEGLRPAGPMTYEKALADVEERLQEALGVAAGPTDPPKDPRAEAGQPQDHIPGTPAYGDAWIKEANRTGVYFSMGMATGSLEEYADDQHARVSRLFNGFRDIVHELNQMMIDLKKAGATDQQLQEIARQVTGSRDNFWDDKSDIQEGRFRAGSGEDQFTFLYNALHSTRRDKLVNDGLDNLEYNNIDTVLSSMRAGMRKLVQSRAEALELSMFPDEDELRSDANIALLNVLREIGFARINWAPQERANFDAFLARVRYDLENNFQELTGTLGPGAIRRRASELLRFL